MINEILENKATEIDNISTKIFRHCTVFIIFRRICNMQEKIFIQ